MNYWIYIWLGKTRRRTRTGPPGSSLLDLGLFPGALVAVKETAQPPAPVSNTVAKPAPFGLDLDKNKKPVGDPAARKGMSLPNYHIDLSYLNTGDNVTK